MQKIKAVVYSIGGYDETKKNNNIVETIYYTESELAEFDAQAAKEAARQALLDKLSITADEAKLLLGGN
jgi:hypothetical protein